MDFKNTENQLIKTIPVKIKKGKTRINNYDINYVRAGKGEPLLLIHGGNIGWGQWYPNIDTFSKFFDVYALDLPGAGRSTRVNFSKLDLEKDFVEIVEKFIKIHGFKNLNIIGSSIGGWIALKLALRKNTSLKKIILVDCIGFTNHIRFADRIIGIKPFAQLLSKTALKATQDNKKIESFMRGVFYNKSADIRREFISYFYETMDSSHNLLLISRLSSFWGIRREFKLERELPKIKNEILVIWGEKDKLMPPEKCYKNIKLIPKAKIEIIKNAGHIPSIEKSNEFNKLVIDYFKPGLWT